jgi:hypothetical protein
MIKLSNNDSHEVLFLVIATDLLFIILHLLHVYSPYFTDSRFSLEIDRSFSEVFQYVKQYWIALIFCWLSILKFERSYLVWALLFGYLLLDDALMLHEVLGKRVAKYLQYHSMFKLRARDLGELTVNALAGMAFLLAIVGAYCWGTEEFRGVSKRLMLVLFLLVFFGVVDDMVHVTLPSASIPYQLLGVIEDGGEMVVMSVIGWYVLDFLMRARNPCARGK